MHDDPGAHESIHPPGSEPAERALGDLAPPLLAVQILCFEKQADEHARARMRATLHRLVEQALDHSGIEPTRVTVTGDLVSGVVLEAESPSVALQLLRLFAPRLAAGLAQHNRASPGTAEICVRAAIEVSGSGEQPSGRTLEQLASLLELLDGKTLEDCAPSGSAPMVLLATNASHGSLGRGSDNLEQAGHRLIEYECTVAPDGTEVQQRVWLHVSGSSRSILGKSILHLLAALPVQCPVLAVDIKAFGDRRRRDPGRKRMRKMFRQLLEEILADAGLQPIYIGDRGDGWLLVFPPETADIRLIDPVATTLTSRLGQYNLMAPHEEIIRLRAVVNRCWLTHDGDGLVGEDLNTTYRLLDSPALRRRLSRSSTPLALIISDDFYQRVVKHGHDGVDPAAFHRVWVNEKETQTHAWISSLPA